MRESDQTINRYLLGEMSEAEQTALEQNYFADSQLFAQVVEAEQDLVDQYARGQLAPETRQRFEEHYLAHPKRRERADFAHALTTHVHLPYSIADPPSSRAESWWSRLWVSISGPRLGWALSLVVLLLIGGLVWFAIQARRLHQELARTEAERAQQEEQRRDLQRQIEGERARANGLASQLDQLRSAQQAHPAPTPPGQSAPTFAALILNVAGVRGADTGPAATLSIPSGTEQARIQLNLRANEYKTYSIVIQTADGKQVFKRDGLQSQNKKRASLAVTVPANRFSGGDYILTLKGVTQSGDIEDVSKSLFHVNKNGLR